MRSRIPGLIESKASGPVFWHVNSAAQASCAIGSTMIFNNVLSDSHGGYSTSTGRYTFKVPGYYKIDVMLLSIRDSSNTDCYVDIRLNGSTPILRPYSQKTSGYHAQATGSVIYFFNASQFIDVFVSGGVTMEHNQTIHSVFQGHRIA